MERKLIAAAVSSALVLPMAAQAVEFAASGHINRAIISVDGGGAEGKPDAHDGDVQHVDANSSETRFRFTGSEELESGMTAGVQLEFDNFFGGDNAGKSPPESGNQAHSTRTIRTRHGNVYLSTAGGKITIGQGLGPPPTVWRMRIWVVRPGWAARRTGAPTPHSADRRARATTATGTRSPAVRHARHRSGQHRGFDRQQRLLRHQAHDRRLHGRCRVRFPHRSHRRVRSRTWPRWRRTNQTVTGAMDLHDVLKEEDTYDADNLALCP